MSGLPQSEGRGITPGVATERAVWSVYIIRTEDNRLYSGVTTDVVRRFREHRAGGVRAARYLKAHPPHELVFSMAIGTRSQAQKVEYHLKRLPRVGKEAVIRSAKLAFDPATGAIAL